MERFRSLSKTGVKTVKLTNGEIFNAKEPLEKLLKERLPLKSSYGLAKLAGKFADQLAETRRYLSDSGLA